MKDFYPLVISLDKKKYRDIFYDNVQSGQWHWSVPKRQELFWFQLFIQDNHKLKPLFKDLEEHLGIYGMNNFPRFSYQFPSSYLEPHLDEDNMVAININLLDSTPIIHIRGKPFTYEAALINVGKVEHSVEPDPNPRLILKFCLRHEFQEVYSKLKERKLIRETYE